MSSWRNDTYAVVRAANDARALRRGRIAQRLWNRAVGRMARRLFR